MTSKWFRFEGPFIYALSSLKNKATEKRVSGARINEYVLVYPFSWLHIVSLGCISGAVGAGPLRMAAWSRPTHFRIPYHVSKPALHFLSLIFA